MVDFHQFTDQGPLLGVNSNSRLPLADHALLFHTMHFLEFNALIISHLVLKEKLAFNPKVSIPTT